MWEVTVKFLNYERLEPDMITYLLLDLTWDNTDIVLENSYHDNKEIMSQLIIVVNQ